MLPYWALFGSFGIAAMISDRKGAVTRAGLLLWAGAAIIILMIGFRYRVGGDWYTYLRNFSQVAALDLESSLWVSTSDPGYSFVSWFAHQVGAGIWFVNLFCGIVLVYGIMQITIRQPNPWLVFVAAIPYLIIVVGMGYTRQSAAIGFSLIAISFLLRDRLLPALIALFVATAFHKSAIIVLPIAGLAYANNRFLVTACISLALILLYYFFLRDRKDILAENYIRSELESRGAAIRIAMNVAPAIIFLLFQRKFGFSEVERKLWRNVSLASLAAAVSLVMLPSSTVVDRLALYLVGIQLVVFGRLPWVFGHHRSTRFTLLALVVIYSASVQLVWLNYATHAKAWVPYRMYPLFS